jgi:hypothetical protein
LIAQGGVKVNGEQASAAVEVDPGRDGVLLQVGKLKFLKVVVNRT